MTEQYWNRVQTNMSCLGWMFITLVLSLSAYGQIKNVQGSTDISGHNIDDLRVEYRTTPMGIDVEMPRFSWKMTTDRHKRGQKQKAYQIVVKDEQDKIVWNSAKVVDDGSLHLVYQGEKLRARTRYHWQVTVWDETNRTASASSWFETGLMNADLQAWNGAKWIGGGNDSLPLYADYLALYELEVDVQIAVDSGQAGIVFAANDPRFLDKNKNIYQLERKKGQSYFKVLLDISALQHDANGEATLSFYHVGYHPDDQPNVAVKQFRIKREVINQQNMHGFHHVLIHSELGNVTVQIDNNPYFYADAPQANPITEYSPKLRGLGAKVTLNPLGTQDVVTYGMLNEIGFYVPQHQQANYQNLSVKNIHEPNNTLFTENLLSKGDNSIYAPYLAVEHPNLRIENGQYRVRAGQENVLITANPSHNGMPQLRTEFNLVDKKIQKARLYATARGIYDLYINGKRISEDYYNPGLSQYNISHLYQTYDVTAFLKSSGNAIGAVLGEGWWSGLLGYGVTWHAFADRQSLLAQLVISYDDGSEQIIVSEPDSWQFNSSGPLRYGSLTMGEVYDARLEISQQGWTQAHFTKQWQKALEVTLENSLSLGANPNYRDQSQALSFDKMALVGQIDEAVRQFKKLPSQSVSEVRKGVFVYDLGQNIVGVPRLTFKTGIAGKQINIRFSEMLYPDKAASGPNAGMIMTENYRAALSQDIYIMKDGRQTFQPRFTSHGFRYIEVTGIDKALPLAAVEGIALSSIQALTADYESSNQKVNQLWSNLVWSNIGNFLSVPTDCPQRNERMGWSGDLNVFAPTATYISQASPFLRRHLRAMRDTQDENGRFADIAPIGGGFGGLLWGIAGVTVAWQAYQQYADIVLLQEHYPAMRRYMTYLDSKIDPETGFISDASLGDWLGPQYTQLGSAYLASAYHIYALDIMSKMATLTGHEADSGYFTRRYQERKHYFNTKFMTTNDETLSWSRAGNYWNLMDGTLSAQITTTHSAYAVGLALDVFKPDIKQKMAAKLANVVNSSSVDDAGIVRPPYSLMTGFIGTAWLSKALSEYGYSNEAYRLLLNESYPSWLYSVNQGATTIWERLNGYTLEEGFGTNNGMNSFNHYSFGAVGEWLIAHSAGISRGEAGFKTFVLKPELDPEKQITWVKGHYDSPYGAIHSSWSIKNGVVHYRATVPANTEATLILKAKHAAIKESGRQLTQVEGVSLLSADANSTQLTLASGVYDFAYIPKIIGIARRRQTSETP